MKITDHVHALRIPFEIPLPDGNRLERFVYCFLVVTPQKVCLIDSGVAGSHQRIFDYLESIGRDPREIDKLVLTHAHPDHIGSALQIRQQISCSILAHASERDWIEDVARQNRERPVPAFNVLVSGSVSVDATIDEGDEIDLSAGLSMKVLHTPGHSRGSICLHIPHEALLVTGDAVLVPSDLPIYDDRELMSQSIRKLQRVTGIDVLLSSWDMPRRGDQVGLAMSSALTYLDRIAEVTRQIRSVNRNATPLDLTRGVLVELGLPPHLANPLVVKAIAG